MALVVLWETLVCAQKGGDDLDSNRPDPSRFYEEDDELFLFDSIINEAKNSTIPAEDHFSSPFVEEDAEWFRSIFDHSDMSTGENTDTSLPPDPLSSEYTILSRQEARDELKTNRVKPETAATVQNAIGSAGIMNPRQKTKAPEAPAPAAVEPPKSEAVPPVAGSASAEASNVKEKLARRARMVSGAVRPVSQEPDPAQSTASTNKVVKKNLQRPSAPVSKTEEPVSAASVGTAPRVRKTVPVAKPAPKAAAPVKTAPAAVATTSQPAAKKKGGAHVAPRKKRSLGLFGSKETEVRPAEPVAKKPTAPAAAPKAAGSVKQPAASAGVKKPAASTGIRKPAAPVSTQPKQASGVKPAAPAPAKQKAPSQARKPAEPKARPVAGTGSRPAPAKKTAAPKTAKAEPKKAAPRKKKKKISKARKKTRVLTAILALLLFLIVNYGLFVYSSIPFYEKWRTIYIETAMSTLNHQWLATKFIPDSIIQDVMKNVADANEGQKKVKTVWKKVDKNSNARVVKKSNKSSWFYDLYWEIDKDSFEKYLDKHPTLKKKGYDELVINNLDERDKNLKTKFGETIRVLDVPENLLIVEVTGGNYVGTLAICKNPDQITMKKAQDFGNMGDQILNYTKKNVLAINGSGFQDPGGEGVGGTIVGSFVLDGKEYGKPEYNYLFFGYKEDHRLYISWGIEDMKSYDWGLQFAPALIVNGNKIVQGTNGWGLQPRTAIGQTEEGEFLLLIVDGRQVGYSLGCTVEDCANIMDRHKAYQAVNMDGGSSSIMAYRDRIITRNSSALEEGRYLPNAIVVQKAAAVEDTDKKNND